MEKIEKFDRVKIVYSWPPRLYSLLPIIEILVKIEREMSLPIPFIA